MGKTSTSQTTVEKTEHDTSNTGTTNQNLDDFKGSKEFSLKRNNTWHSLKWKKNKKEFLKGKVCWQCGSNEYLIPHHPQKKGSLTHEEYISLEGCVVLCRRCHYALHKGLHLCPKCKKRYTSHNYCRSCEPLMLEVISEKYYYLVYSFWDKLISFCDTCPTLRQQDYCCKYAVQVAEALGIL